MTQQLPELIMLKRLLDAIKDAGGLTGTEANAMINDACEEAYRDLDDHDKMIVGANLQLLRDHAKKKDIEMGEKSAYVALAFISCYMEEPDGDDPA